MTTINLDQILPVDKDGVHRFPENSVEAAILAAHVAQHTNKKSLSPVKEQPVTVSLHDVLRSEPALVSKNTDAAAADADAAADAADAADADVAADADAAAAAAPRIPNIDSESSEDPGVLDNLLKSIPTAPAGATGRPKRDRPMKVMIATPAYGGNFQATYVGSIIRECLAAFQRSDIELSFVFLNSVSLVPLARDGLATYAFHKKVDKLVFVDADIGWTPGDIIKLCDLDLDHVCGLCPAKEFPVRMILNLPKEKVLENPDLFRDGAFMSDKITQIGRLAEPGSTLIRVRHAPTGFAVIDVDRVLRPLSLLVPTYKNSMLSKNFPDLESGIIYQFFPMLTKPKSCEYLSEDWSFTELIKKMGIESYVDHTVQCTHTGNYTFTTDINLATLSK